MTDKNVEYVIEMVVQDYLDILSESIEDEGITKKEYQKFCRGIRTIAEKFEIDLSQYEVKSLLK